MKGAIKRRIKHRHASLVNWKLRWRIESISCLDHLKCPRPRVSSFPSCCSASPECCSSLHTPVRRERSGKRKKREESGSTNEHERNGRNTRNLEESRDSEHFLRFPHARRTQVNDSSENPMVTMTRRFQQKFSPTWPMSNPYFSFLFTITVTDPTIIIQV